jgi:large subunit ribosomal protein L9
VRVILQKPVDKLGLPGDVVDVADGYARNYLVPRGFAVKAQKGAVKHADSLKRAHEIRSTKEKVEWEQIASRLAATALHVRARAGEEGKLFGSVTAADIAQALNIEAEVVVDRKDIRLEEPIRTLGTHSVQVHLYEGVEPFVTLEVEAE